MKGLVINYIKKRFLLSDEYSLDMAWYAVSELALDDIINKKKNDSYAGVLFKNYFPFIRGTKEAIPA